MFNQTRSDKITDTDLNSLGDSFISARVSCTDGQYSDYHMPNHEDFHLIQIPFYSFDMEVLMQFVIPGYISGHSLYFRYRWGAIWGSWKEL